MNKKKIMSLIMALVMLVGVFSPLTALAASEETTKTVTLHKILMDKDTFTAFTKGTKGKDGTEYVGKKITNVKDFFAGTDAGEKAVAKEIDGVYFALKFDADYGKTDEEKEMAGKYVKADANNKLKPANPLAATDDVKEAVGGLTGTGDSGVVFDTENLTGKFEIDEIHDMSTYKNEDGKVLTDMKAVPTKITLPLVNDEGVVENAHVYPKNTEDVPDTHKDFTKEFTNEQPTGRTEDAKKEAAAEPHNVGDVIDYTVTTKVPANTKWKTAFWDDKMTEGLTFIQTTATGDLAGKGISIKYDNAEMNAEWYTLSETENGFTLKLTDKGLEEIAKATEEKTIRLDYHAVLNEKAVVAIPESNDVTFHYGNNKDHGNTPVPNKPNDNGELTVTKNWDTGVTKKDVKFTLYNAQTGKEVTADQVESVDGYKFENPVTITAGETMTYTWKGLNKNTEYKVVEEYNGYSAEYTKGDAGQITVKNYNDNNPKPIDPNEPKVVTGGAKFVKTNVDGTERLANAKFVVKNKEGKFLLKEGTSEADRTAYKEAQKAFEDAVKAYNALEADKQTEEERAKVQKLEKARDEAWNATLKNMTKWEKVDNPKAESEKDNTKLLVLTSNELGQFEIAGLAAGTYTLVEVAPPEGYALPSNNTFDFNIQNDGTQQEKEIDFGVKDDGKGTDNARQIVNKKVDIPQTGGMGTVLFTIVGISLMAGAVVAMKRNREEA
ncbi:pilin N-terminal domain-containing protein [Peptoniphilus harei]|uniref:Isopeptide-forming domain-containing fimbrial protein n=1 Tax=Peptoniphilus harei TaxID=54005 RepID=A0A943SQ25_9FIRM|nr:pilin N-terminal domain-containing protein [Peptoniphilus harei]MBS6534802.1 isopeptide-forming domain-containing fimbrial protein [Peptoniphilus harei]